MTTEKKLAQVTTADGETLTLWHVEDGEGHWFLARDEDDAWAVFQEAYEYGDDVKREDVTIRPCSEEWASSQNYYDEDGKTVIHSLMDEARHNGVRGLVASTCW